MLRIPEIIFTEYIAHLEAKSIPQTRNTEYKKWLRYFLDFCDKYPVPPGKADRVRLFCDKLKEKRQTEVQRDRAAHAVSLYFEMFNNSNIYRSEVIPSPGEPAYSNNDLASPGRNAPKNEGRGMETLVSPGIDGPRGDGAMRPSGTLPGQESYYVS